MGWQSQVAIRALSVLVGTTASTQINLFTKSNHAGALDFLFNNAGFTNGELAGGVIGAPAFAAVKLAGGASTVSGFTDFVQEQYNSSDGVSSLANAVWAYVDTASAHHNYMVLDGSGVNITTGNIAGIAPGTGTNQSNPAVRDTWQVLSLSNSAGSGNNINGFTYRVLGEVDEGRHPFLFMAWDITVSANSPSTIGTLASGYAPATEQTFPTGWYGNGPAAYSRTFAPRLMVDTSGNVTTQGGVLNGMALAGSWLGPLGTV